MEQGTVLQTKVPQAIFEMNEIYPQFWHWSISHRTSDEDIIKISNISNEQIELWREDVQKTHEENLVIVENRKQVFAEAISLLVAVKGKDWWRLPKLKKEAPIGSLTYFPKDFDRCVTEKITDARKRVEKIDLVAAKKRRAVEFLEKRGIEPSSNPVGQANDIAFDEEVAKRKAEGGWASIDFDNDCDPHCKGWDMEDRRCECGAHRICWESDGDFEDIHIYTTRF